MKAEHISPNRSKHRHRQEAHEVSWLGIFKSSAIGVFLSFIAATIILLLASYIVCGLSDPDAIIPAFSVTLLYSTAFLSGLFSAFQKHSPPIPCGIYCGIIINVLIWIFSLFLPQPLSAEYSAFVYILLRLLIPVLSVMGALSVYVYRKNSAKKAHRRHHG